MNLLKHQIDMAEQTTGEIIALTLLACHDGDPAKAEEETESMMDRIEDAGGYQTRGRVFSHADLRRDLAAHFRCLLARLEGTNG